MNPRRIGATPARHPPGSRPLGSTGGGLGCRQSNEDSTISGRTADEYLSLRKGSTGLASVRISARPNALHFDSISVALPGVPGMIETIAV